ncbi:hypothetical protein WJX72_004044 [[Myrmecia] bisecta]|uniref:Peptidylglycine monooxygenase n=1 Tax=[Myrmecia] bisecta TaxID=41462 RepID=A0AAW1PZX3_9CHLO
MVTLPKKPSKLVGVEPLSKKEVVHHMLLFGCSGEPFTQDVWDCHMQSPCLSGHDRVLYGWGKNAPAMQLPEGVGYGLGKGSSFTYLVLQVHYLEARPPNDQSGIRLILSPEQVPYAAGMINYASTFTLPPKQQSTLVPNQCCYNGFETLHGFAFRVHTHVLGRSVFLDKVTGKPDQPHKERLVEYSPQLPQGFNPVNPNLVFRPGDRLEATCDFDSSDQAQAVNAGSTHNDEMCNLYMMVWSQRPFFMTCVNNHGVTQLHDMGGVPAAASLVEDTEWTPPAHMGQVSGVAKGEDNSIWVFHRGDRTWDAATYADNGAGERVNDDALIRPPVIEQLDQDTGKVLRSWGGDTFSLPHMISLDPEGNIWVTDTGLHQALKFAPDGQKLMEIGERFVPGHDDDHLCKPTQVAVANDGTIYIADGYCNARVVQYAPDGAFQGEFKLPSGAIDISHSLLLDECAGMLLVADREAAKVHRFDLHTRALIDTWDVAQYGPVYALAKGPYGAIFALSWARNTPAQQAHLLLLASAPEDGVETAWLIEGVQAPHAIAITAAPVHYAGTHERPLALFVSETLPSGSRLVKYTLLPEGSSRLQQEALSAEDAEALRTASHSHGNTNAHVHGGGQAHPHPAHHPPDATTARSAAESHAAHDHGPEVDAADGDSAEGQEEHVPFLEDDDAPAIEAVGGEGGAESPPVSHDPDLHAEHPSRDAPKENVAADGYHDQEAQPAQRSIPTMAHDMGAAEVEGQRPPLGAAPPLGGARGLRHRSSEAAAGLASRSQDGLDLLGGRTASDTLAIIEEGRLLPGHHASVERPSPSLAHDVHNLGRAASVAEPLPEATVPLSVADESIRQDAANTPATQGCPWFDKMNAWQFVLWVPIITLSSELVPGRSQQSSTAL